MVEAGLADAHGATKRSRTYTLSASLYLAVGSKAAYTRQAGFSEIQHEQMVLSYVGQHGRIKRAEVIELCRVSPGQALKILKRLVEQGRLVLHGERKGAYYMLS
ncbi:hypothetical protein GMPD_02360 [Geomonas paludis]|uniref:Uncharacterized protein n=1 Tax=Geomonas paludis TaxID=2740185 RepID=A0A6V8MR92_9BACT|nr:hypothetical protein GMPD_02360 [Geomonas paludis]